MNVPQDIPPLWSTPCSPEAMKAGDGEEAIHFIHTYGRVTKTSLGGAAGEPLRLRRFQQRETYRLLARDPSTGRRKHRVALIGMGRKNGKSGWGSGIALYLADVEEPGGEIYVVAADKDQARIVFNVAKRMVELDGYLSTRFVTYTNELVIPTTGTVIRILSADASRKDGYNPNAVIFDEVHAQKDTELWDAMALGMGARIDPIMIGITTAGHIRNRFGQNTLCRDLYLYGRQLAKGEIEDPTFMFTWWEHADPNADHRDPEVWIAANPGIGDLVSFEDLKSTVARTPEASFRAKRCNMWVMGGKSAFPFGAYKNTELDVGSKLGGESVTFGGGMEVKAELLNDSVMFLDGSWSGDSTGIVGCTRDGHTFVITHYERRMSDPPEWRVPVNSVVEDVKKAFDSGVRLLVADPHRWQQTLSDLTDEGYPVVEWPTNSLARIIPAWKDYYSGVMDGDITHEPSPALDRHHNNTVLKIDARGSRPTKESPSSTAHIDLCICAIGAYTNRNVDVVKKIKPWSFAG